VRRPGFHRYTCPAIASDKASTSSALPPVSRLARDGAD